MNVKSYDDQTFLVRGSHAPVDFSTMVLTERNILLDPNSVHTGYCRHIPAARDDPVYSYYLVTDVKPGRGAFLATWCNR